MRIPSMLIMLLCLILFAAAPVAAERELGERVLSRGAWGADVFILQQHLAQVGYDIQIDGHFGSRTQSVVTAFQLAHGLTPDGVAGAETIAVLRRGRPVMTYTVVAGDSLWKIAQQFDTTMEELIATNNLPDAPLQIGQQLRVPMRPTYTVQSGDTLSVLARRFGTTTQALAEKNAIVDPSRIQAGMELYIP